MFSVWLTGCNQYFPQTVQKRPPSIHLARRTVRATGNNRKRSLLWQYFWPTAPNQPGLRPDRCSFICVGNHHHRETGSALTSASSSQSQMIRCTGREQWNTPPAFANSCAQITGHFHSCRPQSFNRQGYASILNCPLAGQ